VIVDSVLLNAKAYVKGEIVDCALAIEEGKIAKVGRETHMPKADEKTDIHNLLVLPGLIDEHVHLRDEGKAYKEDFTSGTSAASAGGFTTVLDMPNNAPVTMSAKTLGNRIELAQRRILVNVGFYSELPKTLPEVEAIAEQGAVGFKLFMSNQMGGVNVDDDTALKGALKAVGDTGLPLVVHAEDHCAIAAKEEKFKAAQKIAVADYLRAHSEAAELKAVKRILNLAKKTGAHLHFLHISTAKSLEAIAEAKKADVPVTCEVTPNHLMLTNNRIALYGGLAIVAPPLRDRVNVEALWRGILDGVVDTLGSDHAPHTLEEKTAQSVWDIKPGIPGLEVTLPLMLSMVKERRLSIDQLVSLLAEKPSELFGLSDRGKIEEGKTADLTIVDYRKFKVDTYKFKSKAKFSPYNGWELWGRVDKTLLAGEVIFEGGEIVAKAGTGQVVRGGTA
jgi:dihydroorotase (multifunctional complex type)